MSTNLVCSIANFFDIIEFLGFLGITIVASLIATTQQKVLNITKKLGIKAIIIIILWTITAIVMFFDAFIC